MLIALLLSSEWCCTNALGAPAALEARGAAADLLAPGPHSLAQAHRLLRLQRIAQATCGLRLQVRWSGAGLGCCARQRLLGIWAPS
jgi:hypothetical protein